MTTVVVAGPIANKPFNAGEAWCHLTAVRGLLRLGVDAYLLEEIAPSTCVSPDGAQAGFAESANAAYFRRAVGQLGLQDRAALISASGEETEGLPFERVLELADTADLLVNVSGNLRLPAIRTRFRRAAYLDLDPGFTQHWHEAGSSGSRLDGHDVYFTVGYRVGTPECSIPTCGIDWRPTRPIVLLDDWPVANGERDRFTTVSSWRGPFGRIEENGRRYGLKAHEFRRFLELPERAPQRFELALDIHPQETTDLARVRRHGWHLVDPRAVAGDPLAYRRYLQGSSAEFGVAQGVYVETRSGWASDRTARYLASGKPALIQDTGLDGLYPAGEGLVPFTTLDEAVEGAASIARDYDAHAEAARALAEGYFDATVVLARLLQEAGVD